MTAGDPAHDLVIRPLSYDDPVVRALEAELQAEYINRYGGEDETPVGDGQFDPPDGLFIVAFLGSEPVASGGFRRHSADAAEIKRMYVPEHHRREGLARRLLAELETHAAAAGYRRTVLVTGLRQPEAIALYESSGYQPIAPFGFHADDGLVRCFGKELKG
ncbi:MAG: GNAT family N-acetyltransferase [Actinomycetota bacterium]